MRNSYNSKTLDEFEFPKFTQLNRGLHASGLSGPGNIISGNAMSQPTSISLGSLSFGSGYIASPTMVTKQRSDRKHGKDQVFDLSGTGQSEYSKKVWYGQFVSCPLTISPSL